MNLSPRFGLVPLNVADQNKATPGEFMVQPSNGHVYLKQNNGNIISKTVDLEERMIELENRRKATDTHLTLTGNLLIKSMVLPSGITATLQSNNTVRLNGSTSLTNAQIGFVSKYCGFLYSAMESYTIGLDLDGVVKEMTMISQDNKKIKSELVNKSVSKTNVKLSSVVFSDNDINIKEVTPVIVCDMSGGNITIKSMVVSKMDTNVYNAIDHGSSVHIDYRFAYSHLLEHGGIVSGKGYTSDIDTECFKIYKEGTTHRGYLKIYLPNNIIRQGSYSLQLILRNRTASMLDINMYPTGSNFRINTTRYTPGPNGRVIINLKFEWDYKFNASQEVPYMLINCGNTDVALIESVHIVRMHSAKYSDNSLWVR